MARAGAREVPASHGNGLCPERRRPATLSWCRWSPSASPSSWRRCGQPGRLRPGCREFTWERARRELAGCPTARPNIAHEAVDRHAAGAAADSVGAALDRARRRAPRPHLRRAARAHATGSPTCSPALGVSAGDRVFALLGRVPELYVAALGTLKNAQRASARCSRRSGPSRCAQRLSSSATATCSSPPRRSTGARSRRCATSCRA